MKNLMLFLFIFSATSSSFAESNGKNTIYLDGARAERLYKNLPNKFEKWGAGWTHKEVVLDCYTKLMGSDKNPQQVYKCDIAPVSE